MLSISHYRTSMDEPSTLQELVDTIKQIDLETLNDTQRKAFLVFLKEIKVDIEKEVQDKLAGNIKAAIESKEQN